jgi:hypothetical protein
MYFKKFLLKRQCREIGKTVRNTGKLFTDLFPLYRLSGYVFQKVPS